MFLKKTFQQTQRELKKLSSLAFTGKNNYVSCWKSTRVDALSRRACRVKIEKKVTKLNCIFQNKAHFYPNIFGKYQNNYLPKERYLALIYTGISLRTGHLANWRAVKTALPSCFLYHCNYRFKKCLRFCINFAQVPNLNALLFQALMKSLYIPWRFASWYISNKNQNLPQ